MQTHAPTVIVIGAGLSGICMAITLKQQGIDFLVLEKSAEIGGTWSKNIYPGSGCDIPMFAYCYSFEAFKGGPWPKQPEILQYFKHCVDKYQIGSHLLLNTAVEDARFDMVAGRWQVRLTDGRVLSTRFLINATGQLDRPRWPNIPGLRDMEIPVVHTAEFPRDLDCHGKRIALLGNGASALQVVEALQPRAKQIHVFSRSAKYIYPRVQYAPATIKRIESDTAFWYKVRDMFIDAQDRYRDLLDDFPDFDPFDDNSRFAEFYAQSEGVDLAAFQEFYQWLAGGGWRPGYPTGCSRPLAASSFHRAIRADNVALLHDAVVEAKAHSLLSASAEYPVDQVICATGFALDNLVPPYRIIGKKQQTLAESWADGPTTYLGLVAPDFPNLFFLYGPNTNTNASSVTFFIECQVNYIRQILALDQQQALLRIEVKPQAVDRFQTLLRSRSVSEQAACASWYKNAHNRNISTFPGGYREYARMAQAFQAQDFDIVLLAQATASANSDGVDEQAVQTFIRETVSAVTLLPLEKIGMADALRDYHMDSILIADFIQRINKRWGLMLAPAAFFEFTQLDELAAYVAVAIGQQQQQDRESETAHSTNTTVQAASTADTAPAISPEQIQLWQQYNRKPALVSKAAQNTRNEQPEQEPIAIIGTQAYLPDAADLDTFWHNLHGNRHAFREVPPERWSWRDYDGEPSEGDRTRVKWGAFLSRVDAFDPLFFKMSPREAELVDPQHRMFLMCAWELLESAGYNPLGLSGRNIGVMLGINLNDYAELVAAHLPQVDVLQMSGLMHLFAANRLSYLLGFTGPSSVVDTACSSSLIAIHRAIQAIHQDHCEMVIAGGANLILGPKMHLLYSKAGMLAEDGRCKTFSSHADGYARGEGVGAVLLKKLSSAERDGDMILGLIRGSAENHGGKANSLTSPNGRAQADLIVAAMTAAKVDPRSVGYIECHGTGTALGDPIEVNALKSAYERLYQHAGLPPATQPHCGLGSLKSNIGHLETAAGVASVIKVLLAMRHRTLPATLHATPRNPQIHLDSSPFYVVEKNRPWQAAIIEGQHYPLRAGVSSFGAGGSNAHLVLEAYDYPETVQSDVESALIPLSARTPEQLQRMVSNLAASLAQQIAAATDANPAPLSLRSVAFTLQLGREAMEQRLCLVVRSLQELQEQLTLLAGAEGTSVPVFTGQVEGELGLPEGFLDAADWQQAVATMINRGRLDKLAELWTKGYAVPWQQFHDGHTPRRAHLPTYPFALQRCWIDADTVATDTAVPGLHPLLHRNMSSFFEQCYQSHYRGDEFFLADHQIRGLNGDATLAHKVLPAVTYLEMVCAGAEIAFASDMGKPAFDLVDVVWAAPAVAARELDLSLQLQPGTSGDVAFEFLRKADKGEEGRDQTTLHCQGRIVPLEQQTAPAHIAVAELRARMYTAHFSGSRIYRIFADMGLEYGPAHQAITDLYVGADEALAVLTLPAKLAPAFEHYHLHPALLDGALQATIGLEHGLGELLPEPRLPFALEQLCLYAPCRQQMLVWIRRADMTLMDAKSRAYDLDLLDPEGHPCVRLRGLTTRALDNADARHGTIQSGMNLLSPVFVPVLPQPDDGDSVLAARIVVFCPQAAQDWVRASLPEAHTIVQHAGMSVQQLVERIEQAADFDQVLWLARDIVATADASAREHVTDAFRVLQALMLSGRDATALQLTLVTRGVHCVQPGESGRPASAGVYGLAGSVSNELPDWQLRLLDIDQLAAVSARTCLTRHVPSHAQALIHRAGEWFSYELAQVQTLPESSPAMGRQRGVYVVVGGAGGVGELWSRYMIEHYDAQLVWIGRRPLDAQLDTKLQQLEQCGSRPMYIAADATDAKALHTAFNAIKARYPRINGVVHSALLLNDRSIRHMDEQAFATVFAAKADISVNLERVFGQEALDFMLMFSSLNTFSHGAGQANYAAGCTFADTYARHLNSRHPYPVKVVNWGFWGDVGVVAGDFYRERLARDGIGAMAPVQGFAALEQLLASPAQQWVVANFLNTEALTALSGAVACHYLDGAAHTPLQQPTVLAALDRLDTSRISRAQTLLDTETDSLAAEWVASVLQQENLLGQRPAADTSSAAHLHARWLEHSLRYLAAQGWLDSSWQPLREIASIEQLRLRWQAHKQQTSAHPDRAARMHLLDVCLQHLGGILRGERPATEVMFPNSSLELVEPVYNGNDIADGFNDILAGVLVQLITAMRKADPTREIRILEIGAGTGGTTKTVLPQLNALSPAVVEYCYTDVSRAFLLHAEARFSADFPALRTAILDVSQPLAEQGFALGQYDFVLATNVLHATPNIRATLQNSKALLKRQGMLLLNELSEWSWFYHLSFGLLEGWWLYQDAALRLPGSPGLLPETWRAVLASEGFHSIVMPQLQWRHLGQFVTVAASDGVVKQPVQGPVPVAAKFSGQARLQATASTPLVDAQPVNDIGDTVVDTESDLHAAALQYFQTLIADALKLPRHKVHPRKSFAEYGLDSILIVQLTNKLRKAFSGLSTTLFFEVSTLEGLVAHLLAERPAELATLVQPTIFAHSAQPPAVRRASTVLDLTQRKQFAARRQDKPVAREDAIAIVGLSGRYPMADDLDTFWNNLAEGRNCSREIPPERWRWADYFDADAEGSGTMYTKWGGFINDVDKFDPLFFRISPREALKMDPQERIFLEASYHAIEDAGYTPCSLADNKQVGVFAGVMNSRYSAQPQYFSIANRVSYVMDFQGPSMAVDTACSSSLTAIHLAIDSLRNGSCEVAIAGGVNVIVDPVHFLTLTNLHMLSKGDSCKSFGAGADGFVDAEGVGAVVLKPLWKAERDGDHIHGVLLGSSVNAGGKTHGYTVPNPVAQAALVSSALTRAGVSPDQLSYLEAHGTGTALGDPIEIAGLTAAFKGATRGNGFCAIGSLKSNIGHCESAAGIAGLTKVLLQLRQQMLVPSIHAQQINPAIDFAQTPFKLQAQLEPWRQPIVSENGVEQTLPRLAGVSSFGAGGANAHLIVREYLPPAVSSTPHGEPVLVPLSARTATQLRQKVEQLQHFLRTRIEQELNLDDIAYTLQVGREALEKRLALIVSSTAELVEQLAAYLQDNASTRLFIGTDNDVADETDTMLAGWLKDRTLEPLAAAWVRGAEVDWTQLAPLGRRRRLSLPLYPFARERYWLAAEQRRVSLEEVARRPDADEQRLALPVRESQAQPLADRVVRATAPQDASHKPNGIQLQATERLSAISDEPHAPTGVAPAPAPVQQASATDQRQMQQAAIAVEEIQDFLRMSLAEALYMRIEDVELNRAFVDLGLDSIVAVEWMRAVNKHIGGKLSASVVYSYPTLREFAEYLAVDTSANSRLDVPAAATPAAAVVLAEVTSAAPALMLPALEQILRETLAQSLYLRPEDIGIEKPFVDLGLDSIVAVEWIKTLNKRFALKLNASRIYDYPDIRQLSAYLQTVIKPPVTVSAMPSQPQHSATPFEPRSIPPHLQPAAATSTAIAPEDKIAIVGMSGRYPMADNLEQYWQNLVQGRDCVTEIPQSRWDADALYDPHLSRPGTINSKWLGVLDGADCFDPLFFQISPADAENMDPQHRLFLQESYRAFEDAGYGNARLSNARCGVYMGIMSSEYYLLQGKSGTQSFDVTANSFAIGAARTAYHLNLKGPSIPVDTACSSSLVAVHLAAQALRNREIDMALAGGVSLYLAPETYLAMCQAGMLSVDGRCKAFDNGANGFVPAEGVGTLVLKRLSDAERDGDPIHAVIIGSGINQDGKTNGITAPSVVSQIALEREVYSRFGIDPRTITYVEAHGTGTKLGDPIELEALATVFADSTESKRFCGIGSVKSNLGHTSGAAGVASVQKVVLAMQHQALVPTLHVQEENTQFDFADSPFFITREHQPWRCEPGATRRAAVSAFGYSGTNAHLVLEEYQPLPARANAVLSSTTPSGVILLSARTAAQLQQRASDLLRYCEARGEALDIAALAFTLQTGREPMRERLGLLLDSPEELLVKLRAFVDGTVTAPGVYLSTTLHDKDAVAMFASDPDLRAAVDKWLQQGQLARVLELWVKGLHIDWGKAYGPDQPRRLHLPGYPFAKERYWINSTLVQAPAARAARLHPLVHQNVSDFYQQKYRTQLRADDLLLRDHVIGGSAMLAGSMQIEMACSAVRDAWQLEHNAGLVVQDIRWLNAFIADREDTRSLHILLTPDADEHWVQFEIVSGADTPQPIVHSCGFVTKANASLTAVMDLEEIQQRCSGNALDQQTLYQRFDSLGMAYGSSLRSVAMLYPGEQEVLARLLVPDAIRDFDDYAIHPCMLEGALHAVFGFRFWQEGAEMPVAIDELQLLSPVPASAWAWLKRSENGYEVRICDDAGRVCLMITGFSTCGIDSVQTDSPATLLFEPGWQQLATSAMRGATPTQHILLMLGCETLESELRAALPSTDCLSEPSGELQSRVTRYGLRALDSLQAAGRSAQGGVTLIQVLYPASEAISLAEPLCALFETAHLENTGIYAQIIPVAPTANATDLQLQLAALRRQLLAPVSRCNDGHQWQRCVREFTLSDADTDTDTALWQERGVYLITGGTGGLGLQVAAWVARSTAAVTLILVGRSVLNDDQRQQMAAWRNRGATVEYHQIDVSNAADIQALVAAVVQRHGRINGILHSAGVISDQRIACKSAAEFAEVLAPKISGALALDNATHDLDLDCFVLFSSFAGYRGNIGQCDYAFANGFLDAFAHWRAAAGRNGRTLAINWPLWKTGGMQVESATLTHLEALTGMQPLPSDLGLPLLESLITMPRHQVLVAYGAAARIRAYFHQQATRIATAPSSKGTAEEHGVGTETRTLSTAVLLQELLSVVATQLKIRLDDLDVDAELSEYGFDSISFTEFANRVNQRFSLTVVPTVFFEYPTLGRFAEFLCAEFHQPLLAALGTAASTQTSGPAALLPTDTKGRAAPSPLPLRIGSRFQSSGNTMPAATRKAEPLAIVGVSGRFPQAESLDEFWKNLSEGRDCIVEIPPERWNWRDCFGDPRTERNRTNIRYGAFMTGIDEFDPLFFGISPREALQMDPQQRLLMTYVWKAIEDAGYAPSSLAGSKTGIFVGTANTGYSELLNQAKVEIEGFSPTGAVASVGPNRMSYLLDLHGPSEAIETACSSSLVAIHRAVQAIEAGDCDMAIVGGINTILTPRHHIAFSKAGMLAEDGRCKTFSSEADGYVRGEGVGMLFLKKLSAAERDGDAIYGLVRGTAENHGGRANSLTAPNPLAQTQLLVTAYRKAGIDLRTVGYIEAHGTGTALGDPVEINALKAAFHELGADVEVPPHEVAPCGLGSVKSNIGHLELAAGVAGVIKVLLQFRHRQRVKTLHCDTINPYIDLADSPFHIQQQADEWRVINDAAGRPLPRRAGVSSFGFGGVNAHVVLEEYQPRDNACPEAIGTQPVAIVLSARTSDSLTEMARELLTFVEQLPPRAESGPRLASLAFTLQVGRDEMEERLAFVAKDETELGHKLRGFLEQRLREFGIMSGRVSRGAEGLAAFVDDEDLDSTIDNWIAKGRLERLLGLWVQGLAINWQRLYPKSPPGRMHLPGYAFARDRFWVDLSDAQAPTATNTGAQLHPLLHVNRSNLNQQCFDSHFEGHESFLNDHQVLLADGARHKILPAVAYLEMARAALQHSLPDATSNTALTLQQIIWLRPCIVDQPQTVSVHVAELDDDSGDIELRIVNGGELLCRLQMNPRAVQNQATVDLVALGSRLTQDILDNSTLYERLAQLGLDFGPTHRALQSLRGTAHELLAEIRLPEIANSSGYVLHPSLLDAALQASIGLLVAGGDAIDAAPLPFALDSLQLLSALPAHLYAWVRRAPPRFEGEDGVLLDIDLLDESGRVCAALGGFNYRLAGTAPQAVPQMNRPSEGDASTARDLAATEQVPLDESHYADITRRLLNNEISLEQALDLEERA